MQFEFTLRQPLAKLAVMLAVAVGCALLAVLAASNFIVSVLTSSRVSSTRGELVTAARYFPNSADLQGLVAEAELANLSNHLETAGRAEAAASRAVSLTPAKYNFHLLLASAREMKGDRAGAESALREALERAPNRTEVQWRLANLLMREGKLDEALPLLARAVGARPVLISQTLALVWSLSGGSIDKLEKAAGETPKGRNDLAFFLLQRGKILEGVNIFQKINRADRLASPESGPLITGLINAGQIDLARRVWGDIVTDRSEDLKPLVFNGGFESDPRAGLTQFDWMLASNKYARVTIDPAAAHAGSRSLRVDFNGIDTTRIDGEIAQQVLLRPGTHYRLSCFVKTSGLVTPEGPRLYVTSNDKTAQVAVSDAISAGSNDWRPLAVDFTAPPWGVTLLVTVRRLPKFSYDEPSRGTIWLDDFTLTEAGGGK